MSESHVSRFDEISKDYTKDLDNNLRLTGGDSQFFYRTKIQQILSSIRTQPKQILDFGCATGTFTRMLSSCFPHASVVGYDPAKECIRIAQDDNVKNESKNLSFIGDLNDLSLHPDLVISTGVFHHIPPSEKQRCMDQIFQLMDTNGKFFIFEHNPYSPLTQLIVSMADVDKGATLIRCGNMKNMLESSGFKNIEHKYITFFPPFLKALLPVEKYLQKVPVGAQYVVMGNKLLLE